MTRRLDRIPVTEADLREWVRDLCKIYRWEFLFVWKSFHSPKGMLDLLLISEEKRRVIFAELKSEKGKMTSEQEEVFRMLKACGQEVYIWQPHDIEQIAKILQE